MLQVTLNLDEAQTKELFKQAILEMLQEKNEVLYEALAEIIEDVGLFHAIQEGEDSETVNHWKVK